MVCVIFVCFLLYAFHRQRRSFYPRLANRSVLRYNKQEYMAAWPHGGIYDRCHPKGYPGARHAAAGSAPDESGGAHRPHPGPGRRCADVGGRYLAAGPGGAAGPSLCAGCAAHYAALPAGGTGCPSGKHCGGGGQCADRCGVLPHRRALRCGVPGADGRRGPAGEGRRGPAAARRRIQAPDIPLLLPGAGSGGHPPAGGRRSGGGPACGDGDRPTPGSWTTWQTWTSCRWAPGICRIFPCSRPWARCGSRCC